MKEILKILILNILILFGISEVVEIIYNFLVTIFNNLATTNNFIITMINLILTIIIWCLLIFNINK